MLRSLKLNYHFYTDDMQIYIHSNPGQDVNISHLSEIKLWMFEHFLCLNSSKTEVMLLGSPHKLRNAGFLALSVDGVALD